MEDYNILDEEYIKYIKGLCFAGIPIDFYGLEINHLTLKDIFIMGEKKYDSLLVPFRISKEILLSDDVGEINLSLLDIYGLPEFEKYLDSIIEYLSVVLKRSVSYFKDEDTRKVNIIIDDTFFIDGYKFDVLSEIILLTNNLKKITRKDLEARDDEYAGLPLEKIQKITNKRERDYQMSIYNNHYGANDKKKKEEKVNYLYNIFNYLVHYEDAVDYDKYLNMTIYRVRNTYEVDQKKDSHKGVMRLVTSGNISDFKKLDTKNFAFKIAK